MSHEMHAGESTPSKDGEVFHLRLYIAGDAPNSAAAVANLRALCEAHLAGRYRIDTVDVLRDPGRALQDGVLITPLLVKLAPEPTCRVAGSLSDARKVIHALGIAGGEV